MLENLILFTKTKNWKKPKTKKEFIISARNTIKFTPSKNIRIKQAFMNKFVNISEAAKILNLINPKTKKPLNHVLRYWEKEFKELNPEKLIIEDITHQNN